ncbi:hypothetical protein CIRG_10372 [Coccidioides immitis RMSCC 2394]|uniref:Uncharacterized protein n=1 Tax=Coccidioides immitis RMSCC 2394 TaxID=404692 RepID=A0A0J6Y7B0_COCIT|nr:hypothetical protein CIRG_10372 [Coccidioides immitis RMSCC 2394]
MAVYLSTVSVGAIIAVAFSLLTVDPRLIWMYYITLWIETLAAGAVLHCYSNSEGVWVQQLSGRAVPPVSAQSSTIYHSMTHNRMELFPAMPLEAESYYTN